MDEKYMVAVVQVYLHLSKGVQVDIQLPRTAKQSYLLNRACLIASRNLQTIGIYM